MRYPSPRLHHPETAAVCSLPITAHDVQDPRFESYCGSQQKALVARIQPKFSFGGGKLLHLIPYFSYFASRGQRPKRGDREATQDSFELAVSPL